MRKTTLFGLIGFVIIAAIVIFVAVGSSGFKNWKFLTWFNGWGQGIENTDTDTDGGEDKTPEEHGDMTIAEYVLKV